MGLKVFTTPSVPPTGDRNPSRKGKDVTALQGFFSKIIPSFLTLKEGSTFLTKPLFPQGREDVTALLGARNRYALRMADHQRSRQIVRDGTAGVLVGIRVLFPVLQVLLLLLSVLLSLQILLPLLLWMWYREN